MSRFSRLVLPLFALTMLAACAPAMPKGPPSPNSLDDCLIWAIAEVRTGPADDIGARYRLSRLMRKHFNVARLAGVRPRAILERQAELARLSRKRNPGTQAGATQDACRERPLR